MIRFQCERCGKAFAVPDAKAGDVGTCPGCKERFRVPQGGASAIQDNVDSGVEFSFSRWPLLKSAVWLLSIQLLAFAMMVGSPAGCVVIVLKEPLSVKVVLGLVTIALIGVVGFCMFFLALASWRLFLFSTIPSSSHYQVRRDRLVRYSRANQVVEEVPFANIADVRMLVRRSATDPEVTAKVLGIDLKNPDDRRTILDRHFCRWSQKVHRHDLILLQDFFAVPLKTVYRTIKKRFQEWQEANPELAKSAPSSPRPYRLKAWYQQPITYILAGLALLGMVGLIVLVGLVSFLLRGNDKDKGTPSPSVANAESPPVAKQAGQAGPGSLPGLVAYWPLRDAQGQDVSDKSGNGSGGHLHGGKWLQGNEGPGLRLGGRGDYVDLGSERKLNFSAAGAFTLAGWIAAESNGVICSFRRRSLIFPIIELSVRQGRLFGWVRDDTSGFGGAKVTGAPVKDSQWHHILLLREGDGTIELFLDGASQGRSRGESSGGPITTDLRALGCDRLLLTQEKAPGYLVGNFKEFRVYNRALTKTEITSLAGEKK